jgi:hypothetical protein
MLTRMVEQQAWWRQDNGCSNPAWEGKLLVSEWALGHLASRSKHASSNLIRSVSDFAFAMYILRTNPGPRHASHLHGWKTTAHLQVTDQDAAVCWVVLCRGCLYSVWARGFAFPVSLVLTQPIWLVLGQDGWDPGDPTMCRFTLPRRVSSTHLRIGARESDVLPCSMVEHLACGGLHP